MKKATYYLLLVLLLLSCKKDHDTKGSMPFRTVLVYLAANNNLSNEALDNMEQMEKNIGEINGNLLIYARMPNTNPALYKVSNTKGQRQKTKIKEYPNHNSSDPYILRQIIQEVQTSYQAKSYGLILWSHATGWVPAQAGSVKLKSFGNDNGKEMDIKELNSALPSNTFDFIMFDACSMAGVEVLYEIKDKSKYFIASPGEVVSNGMPYDKIVNDLFKEDTEAYISIAQKYYNHYNSLSGNFQSATISVIDASKLQSIAANTKKTLEAQTPLYEDFNRNEIQRMDFDRYSNPLIAFDFLDFLQTNYNNPHLNTLQTTINQAILYKANTPKFNGYTISKNSGLTCYIPTAENELIAHDYYRTLQWYTASGFDLLF